MIHTYSLIHDDLPALDNDDFRRGKPTCHKMFGDAMAILAGDALFTLAMQMLVQIPGLSCAAARSDLVAELSTASGTVDGMIGGQVTDIEGEGLPPTPELLDLIHRAKTGALLRASVRMGGDLRGCGCRTTRSAVAIRRTRRAGVSDRGRHSGYRGIVRSLGQDGRQRCRAGQDHLPRGVRPGRVAAHGAGGMRAWRTKRSAIFGRTRATAA